MPPHPLYTGKRLIILPSRFDAPIAAEAIPIYIDSGSAFGDGSHPTTQLCLDAIERHLKTGSSMIDLGTGTGILAIAAAKLDAEEVLAVDTDAEAVRIARENISANGVTNKIRLELGSVEHLVSGAFGIASAPLVVMNILSNVIVTAFDHGLARSITPGGMLILSGLVRAQTPEIRAKLQEHGLRQLAQEQLGDWVCVIAGQEVG